MHEYIMGNHQQNNFDVFLFVVFLVNETNRSVLKVELSHAKIRWWSRLITFSITLEKKPRRTIESLLTNRISVLSNLDEKLTEVTYLCVTDHLLMRHFWQTYMNIQWKSSSKIHSRRWRIIHAWFLHRCFGFHWWNIIEIVLS